MLGDVKAPTLPLNQWWGDEPEPTDWQAYLANSSEVIGNKLLYADQVNNFNIIFLIIYNYIPNYYFPQQTLDDLKAQLNRTLHLAEPLEGVNFEYGFNTKQLQEIIEYWRDDYLPRWREREVFLWQFNHFTTEIQG